MLLILASRLWTKRQVGGHVLHPLRACWACCFHYRAKTHRLRPSSEGPRSTRSQYIDVAFVSSRERHRCIHQEGIRCQTRHNLVRLVFPDEYERAIADDVYAMLKGTLLLARTVGLTCLAFVKAAVPDDEWLDLQLAASLPMYDSLLEFLISSSLMAHIQLHLHQETK